MARNYSPFITAEKKGVDVSAIAKELGLNTEFRFNTAASVIRKMIVAAHKGEQHYQLIKDEEKGINVFEHLTAALDVDSKTITVKLLESGKAEYVINGDTENELVFNYVDSDVTEPENEVPTLADLLFGTVGISSFYSDRSSVREEVTAFIEAMDLATSYDEETQILTVSVKEEDASAIALNDDDETKAYAFFKGQTVEIQFLDDAIDLADILVNRELTLKLTDIAVEA